METSIDQQMKKIEVAVGAYLEAHEQLIELENRVEAARAKLAAADADLAMSLPWDVEERLFYHRHETGVTTVFRVRSEARGDGKDISLLDAMSTTSAVMGLRIAETIQDGLSGGLSPGAVLLSQILQENPAQKAIDDLIG